MIIIGTGGYYRFRKVESVMSAVADLIQRAERLEGQMEEIRQELQRLHVELRQLANGDQAGTPLPSPATDCLLAAVALAEDLGPEFSSEDPHGLAGRGDDWFKEP
jgi:hypothetical protein